MATTAGGAGVAPPVLGVKETILEAAKTPAGMVGFGMLITLLLVVAYVPVVAPFDVVQAWTDLDRWRDNPASAAPEWVDALTAEQKARTLIIDRSDTEGFRFTKSEGSSGNFKQITLRKTFEWNYDEFPSEGQFRLFATWPEGTSSPVADVTWTRPDGESVRIFAGEVTTPDVFPRSLSDEAIRERVRSWALGLGAEDFAEFRRATTPLMAEVGPGMLREATAQVLKGTYVVEILILTTPQSEVDGKFLLYGTVHGLAGTDDRRRDLLVGLLWGAPVALAFGSAAALITVFSQVILGALGAFYGGRWDEVIQRLTDFVIIIPALPILILIGAFYTPSIVHILVIVVAFSILGGSTKVVRSIVLQVKEEMYIESAWSYGAGRLRILMKHVMPRTLPYTFALLALAVPSFIFLEAALSFLGVGDPILPTWGKVLGEAYIRGAIFNGSWWWVGLPAAGILYTTVAFAFLGYAFDKVLNPRLREQ